MWSVWITVLMMFSAAYSQATEINLVHFNIRELDSTKIAAGLVNDQVANAVQVLRRYPGELVSINEMQFDQPNVPNASFQTTGQNMQFLMDLVSSEASPSFQYVFAPANTGRNARRKANGEYEVDTRASGVMNLADRVNFGIFPGQYSSAGASRFPIREQIEVSDLPWKAFHRNLDLSPFRDAAGNALPESMELFDKNFSDAVLQIDGKLVHFILLHTVPAHNFGNDRSPNDLRNHDQLAFLQWYLTGQSSVFSGREIRWRGRNGGTRVVRPLTAGATFVALGDWNVDVRDSGKLGSVVLAQLLQQFKPWKESSTPFTTYESSTFDPNPWEAQLDYMLFSNDFVILDGGVHSPPANRTELGCGNQTPAMSSGSPERVRRSYTKNVDGGLQTCWVEVDAAFAERKEASDHKLIWARVRL